ncbi:MAG: hypothetical protein ACOCRX_01905 [Candidatus Woesearchaeota archaeon]
MKRNKKGLATVFVVIILIVIVLMLVPAFRQLGIDTATSMDSLGNKIVNITESETSDGSGSGATP